MTPVKSTKNTNHSSVLPLKKLFHKMTKAAIAISDKNSS